jgi:hypothetical protein
MSTTAVSSSRTSPMPTSEMGVRLMLSDGLRSLPDMSALTDCTTGEVMIG